MKSVNAPVNSAFVEHLAWLFVSNKFTAMQRTKESWIGLSVLCRWFTLISLKFFKFEQLESRFLVFCAYFI